MTFGVSQLREEGLSVMEMIEYEAPQISVCGVFLEGAIAESGTISTGSSMQYNEYDEVDVLSTGSEYTVVF
jgi:hypothetical protein